MRPPFFFDHLSREDQRTVRQWYGRLIVVYCTLIALVFMAVAIRNYAIDEAGVSLTQCGTRVVAQANELVGASSANAAVPEAPRHSQLPRNDCK